MMALNASLIHAQKGHNRTTKNLLIQIHEIRSNLEQGATLLNRNSAESRRVVIGNNIEFFPLPAPAKVPCGEICLSIKVSLLFW